MHASNIEGTSGSGFLASFALSSLTRSRICYVREMSDDFAFSSKEVDRRQAESEYPEFVGPVYVDGDDARRKESILSPLSPIIPKDRHFSETSDSILAEHVHSVADGATEELKSSSIHQAAGTSKKIGWHRISTTWRVVLGLAVVGIILLAALLGHFLGAKSSGTSTSPPDAFDILPTSQLAASTWRDADNNTVKTVFFQDSSLAIIMAKRNSTTDGWYFQNVSASVEGSYLLPKAGTPLQSTAPDYVNAENFWVELFFVAVGNHPSQIWSWNLPGKKDAWYTDTLQGFETIFPTGFLDGTQLAVYRDQCGASCSGSSRLVCQAGNRDLMMAYSNVSTITTWTGAWNVTDLSEDGQGWFAPDGLPPLETNASLAVTRYSPGPGMDPSGMRLYYDVSGQLLEYLYVNGSWTKGERARSRCSPGFPVVKSC